MAKFRKSIAKIFTQEVKTKAKEASLNYHYLVLRLYQLIKVGDIIAGRGVSVPLRL
jgi:hypothetical protein